MITKKRRRAESKTDYLARKTLLKSKEARIVFRKTNRYVIGQLVKSREAQDFVITGVNSKELENYGWPKAESIKSLPACYLTGYVLGKKMNDKDEKSGILDIGLLKNVHGSKIYAFVKGLVDAGIKIPHKPEIFPDEKRLEGKHLKKAVKLSEIKSTIDKKLA